MTGFSDCLSGKRATIVRQIPRAKRDLNILHVSPTFFPATFWGGPIVSTHALCNALASKPGIALRVLTTDAAGPERRERVRVDKNPMVFPAGYEVRFARRISGHDISPELIARLSSMIAWSDVVHLTGVYSSPTIPLLALCRMHNRPVVWSTRGALLAADQWSSARHLRRKKIWESVCRAVRPARCVLHVTSRAEEAACMRRMPGMEAAVIPNGVDGPECLPERTWMPGGLLRVMFLGRLDKVKALENLIGAVARMPGGTTRLEIYGRGGRDYVAQLVALVARCDLQRVVRFHGHVEGAEKADAFRTADVCVLPSHSENFGMAAAEAMAHGMPVIVSHGVPWADVEARGCGIQTDNDPASLAVALESLRCRDLAAMGGAGRTWMLQAYDWRRIADDMVSLYRTVAGA